MISYTGLWPTSTNANSGASAGAKAALSSGKALRTSGHQESFVVGSLDDMKAIKSGLLDSSSRLTEVGAVMDPETGIFEI